METARFVKPPLPHEKILPRPMALHAFGLCKHSVACQLGYSILPYQCPTKP